VALLTENDMPAGGYRQSKFINSSKLISE